jgi:hypothetical protein
MLLEHWTENPGVPRSTPGPGTRLIVDATAGEASLLALALPARPVAGPGRGQDVNSQVQGLGLALLDGECVLPSRGRRGIALARNGITAAEVLAGQRQRPLPLV